MIVTVGQACGIHCCYHNGFPQGKLYRRKLERRMCNVINYEEEIAKFQPSLEVDQAEEAIYNNDLTDIMDILAMVTKGKNETEK